MPLAVIHPSRQKTTMYTERTPPWSSIVRTVGEHSSMVILQYSAGPRKPFHLHPDQWKNTGYAAFLSCAIGSCANRAKAGSAWIRLLVLLQPQQMRTHASLPPRQRNLAVKRIGPATNRTCMTCPKLRPLLPITSNYHVKPEGYHLHSQHLKGVGDSR